MVVFVALVVVAVEVLVVVLLLIKCLYNHEMTTLLCQYCHVLRDLAGRGVAGAGGCVG